MQQKAPCSMRAGAVCGRRDLNPQSRGRLILSQLRMPFRHYRAMGTRPAADKYSIDGTDLQRVDGGTGASL